MAAKERERAREKEKRWKGRDTATDSAQQVVPLPRAFLSPACTLVSCLPLFVTLVVLSPHFLLFHPRCSFLSPAFSTFVNVAILSSDPIAVRISRRLITRYLSAVVIYNFRCIIFAILPINYSAGIANMIWCTLCHSFAHSSILLVKFYHLRNAWMCRNGKSINAILFILFFDSFLMLSHNYSSS